MKKRWLWQTSVLLAAAGLLAATAFAAQRPAGDVLALMYHDLAEDGADETQLSPWRTTPAHLREDLQTILSAGYAPLSVEAYAAGEYDPGRDYCIVTFDDGYTSNLTLAEPVLRELGVPASVFVITSMVGEAGHMTWEELRRLSDGGVFTVYSHTHTHSRADCVSAEAFLQDAERSWAHLEARGFSGCRAVFSFPHGAYTEESLAALAEAGCRLLLLQQDVRGVGDAVRILVRLNAAPGMDWGEVLARRRTG